MSFQSRDFPPLSKRLITSKKPVYDLQERLNIFEKNWARLHRPVAVVPPTPREISFPMIPKQSKRDN